MKPSNTVISFNHVSKEFYLQEERTFKELLPNLMRGRGWAKRKIVFSDLSFSIQKGETVGIVGKNGAGKSTLMKLIAGVTYPTTGTLSVSESVAPLIELTAGFHHELTGIENIYLNAAILGLHKKQTDKIVDSIIDFSELREYIYVPLKRYSTGMQMRLAFAIVIQTQAPILLIDEVLAVGDASFQEKCLSTLESLKKTGKHTIVFVSHDADAVEKFCDRVLVLNEGKLIFDGNPQKGLQVYDSLIHNVDHK